MIRTREEWSKFCFEKGSSGDQVFDILRDWEDAMNYEDSINFLNQEIEHLRKWVADLQGGMYVNCVYCGHRYPPGIPDIRDAVLYEHIKECPKHPLSKAILLLKELWMVVKNDYRIKGTKMYLELEEKINEICNL